MLKLFQPETTSVRWLTTIQMLTASDDDDGGNDDVDDENDDDNDDEDCQCAAATLDQILPWSPGSRAGKTAWN